MRIAFLSMIVLLGLAGGARSQQQPAASSAAAPLERYVGQYQLAPSRIITISREGAKLFAQNTGAPRVEIKPAGEAEFAYTGINARIRFVTDGSGNTTQLVVASAGTELVAKRLSAEEASRIESLAKPNIEVPIDASLLKSYAGYYEIQKPYLLFEITQKGSGLFAQIIGQPKAQIFAKSEREFFYKIVPGQIAFTAPIGGLSRAFVLSMGGIDYKATRIANADGERKSKEVLAQTAAAETAAAKPKKAIALPSEKLKAYVGSYRIEAVDMLITVSLEDSHIYSQTTLGGQASPKQEIFAETPTHFFFKGAPVEITFVSGATGETEKMIVHAGGRDSVGVRVSGAP